MSSASFFPLARRRKNAAASILPETVTSPTNATTKDESGRFLPVVEFAPWELHIQRILFAITIYGHVPSHNPETSQPFPVGLAHFFDLTFLGNDNVMVALNLVLGVLLLGYSAGFHLPWILPPITLIPILVGTLHGSQGSHHHNAQLVHLVLLTQCLYYCRPLRLGLPVAILLLMMLAGNPETAGFGNLVLAGVGLFGGGIGWMWLERKYPHGTAPPATALEQNQRAVYFSVQTIAAVYAVCGLTKVFQSGFFGWIFAAKYFPLQMVKTDRSAFYNTLKERPPMEAAIVKAILAQLSSSSVLSSVAIAPGLLLELGAFIALFGRVWSLVIGTVILSFHLGVGLMMNLHFVQNMKVVIIFFIQVPYWIHRMIKGRKGSSAAPTDVDNKKARFSFTRVCTQIFTNPYRLPWTQIGRISLECWPMLLVVVLCLALRENYPFSHFPMYAKLYPETYYNYVKDHDGNPIPLKTLTSHSSPKLKKIFGRLQKEYELKRGSKTEKVVDPKTGIETVVFQSYPYAAEQTLQWLVENTKQKDKPALEALRPLSMCLVKVIRPENEIQQIEFCYPEHVGGAGTT